MWFGMSILEITNIITFYAVFGAMESFKHDFHKISTKS